MTGTGMYHVTRGMTWYAESLEWLAQADVALRRAARLSGSDADASAKLLADRAAHEVLGKAVQHLSRTIEQRVYDAQTNS